MSLSDRVRPDVEAARWVVNEIKKLEAERDAAVKALRQYGQHLDYCGDSDSYNNVAVRTCSCGFDAAKGEA